MLSAVLSSTTRLGTPVMKVWTCHIWRQSVKWTPKSYFSTKISSVTRLNISWCSSLAQRNHRLFHQGDVRRMLVPCARCSSRYSKDEVTRDILLYKSDKFTFYRILGAFAFAQVLFWTYLTHTAFLTMRDTDTYLKVKYGEEGPPEDVKNWRSWSGIRMQLSSGIWRYTITGLSIGAGSIIFFASFLYSRKSIHRIVLRKGGEAATIQTYGLFGLPWRFTTSINNISCKHGRNDSRTQLPIRVKGHRMFYILDKEGKFYNARLFDSSVGMHRML